MAQEDEAQTGSDAEIERALDLFSDYDASQLESRASVALASGEWTAYGNAELRVMGMVFGNDSYIALQEGEIGDLAMLGGCLESHAARLLHHARQFALPGAGFGGGFLRFSLCWFSASTGDRAASTGTSRSWRSWQAKTT